jgi:hypothetical protein
MRIGAHGVAVLALAGLVNGCVAQAPEPLAPHAKPTVAPPFQTQAEADEKSAGCVSCHSPMDAATMHQSPGVVLGCTDCHGGHADVAAPTGGAPDSAGYLDAKRLAHVAPRFPDAWPTPGNPPRSYTILNRESPEFVRFVNPGDLRVARETCGACHASVVDGVERSLMATGAMFWGGAAYNNGILPYKRYILGEAYTREGAPAGIHARPPPDGQTLRPEHVPSLAPLPSWETVPPADNFRIFERGGRLVGNLFAEIGLPNAFEEPGKPDVRQSNRGPGTGARISVPVLNLHKTRLNDPFLWFLGTSDNPGDHHSSGCTACHAVYANDRSETSSGIYAKHGNQGQTDTQDPTIRNRIALHGQPERGHPIRHAFTRAIPTAQCMTCHHHQPNVFVNSYLGYTMWDYEPDAPLMWASQQQRPSIAETRERLDGNPEEAVVRGRWADPDFMARVWTDVNPKAEHTQFADYHGHGWNFRAVHRRDRKGALLDDKGHVIPDSDPPELKWKRAVHLKDIHADYGMQCADCHFSRDNHGDGNLAFEVAAGVEIDCRDCHGGADAYASLRTSGPAAPPGGTDLSLLRNEDGRRRFVWRDGKLHQRLVLPPYRELEVTQVKDSVDPSSPAYNAKSARAKLLTRGTTCERAHDPAEMACSTCHTAWMTSCAGCHLPIQANWKTERHRYEGGETRNFATYNPQVARDDMFQLGKHGVAKGGIIAPVRSSSALVLSSTDANRNRIYVQQPPVSSAGFSSQAFAPHFPHTVRKTETKTCSDCHVSEANDNNAIMAQLLLLGTQFVNFVGFHAWVGTEDTIEAIQVTEWDEPQAVIGSYLHRYAYPDWYRAHEERGRELGSHEIFAHHVHESGEVGCLQLRGEYLYVAEGPRGMQAFDVSAVGNKGFSERFITAPFSPLGQNVRIPSGNATCVALPTNQPIRPERNREILEKHPENLEEAMHPIYSYAAVTDAEEGLILVNVETLGDFEPRNNFFERALTWNPDGLLDGARHGVFAGHILYVSTPSGVVVIDLDDPGAPRALATIPLADARAVQVQFRYLFALDAEGLQVVDVTHPEKPRLVEGARIRLAYARRLHVARTYAYVAAGRDGLAIIDVERPESPRLVARLGASLGIRDAHDVIVGSTNASLFAYVADGAEGLKVLQLTSPDSQPRFYGFSPVPRPELIAWKRTRAPATTLSRPLERDRGVDETGHQVAVFGRLGSRPFTLAEMQRLYLTETGRLWTVEDEAPTMRRTPECAQP